MATIVHKTTEQRLFLSLHHSYTIFSRPSILRTFHFRILSLCSEASSQPCFCDEGWRGYHCEVSILYHSTLYIVIRKKRSCILTMQLELTFNLVFSHCYCYCYYNIVIVIGFYKHTYVTSVTSNVCIPLNG